MDTIKGRVKKLSVDDHGVAYGFSLHDVQGYFNYSKEEYRGKPWDKHGVGDVIEVGFNPKDDGKGGVKRWVATIQRLDGEEPEWLGTDSDSEGAQHVAAVRAEKLKEVTDGEQDREIRLDRRKAIECAAQVVVAALPYFAFDATGKKPIGTGELVPLIDTCIERFRLGLD